MSTNITGWIEINTINESTESLWFKVIEIDILVEQNYEVFGKLFGIRAKEGTSTIAVARGVPAGTLESNLNDFNDESIVNVTWATFEEIDSPLKELCNAPYMEGWSFILESMTKLNKRFGAGNVRLIVGFDNYG
jgi:hypothetical protein